MFAQLDEESPEVDLLILPETVLSGYFLEGGVREVARTSQEMFDDVQRVFRERARRPDAILDICVGFYEVDAGRFYNSALYATLAASRGGKIGKAGIRHVHRKFFLPTYGVFDEERFVARGRTLEAFDTRLGRLAVLICEDAWHSISATIAALKGAQVILVISASPGRDFSGKTVGSLGRWQLILNSIAVEHSVWVAYCGLVGFEGGKGFTGSSQVIDPWGACVVSGPVTEECLLRTTIDLRDVPAARASSPLLADLETSLADITLEFHRLEERRHGAEEAAGCEAGEP